MKRSALSTLQRYLEEVILIAEGSIAAGGSSSTGGGSAARGAAGVSGSGNSGSTRYMASCSLENLLDGAVAFAFKVHAVNNGFTQGCITALERLEPMWRQYGAGCAR